MPNVGTALGFIKPRTLLNEPHDALVLPSAMVGVEIESCVPDVFETDHWTTVSEGSLRNGGNEYIFTQPLFGADVIHALGEAERKIAPWIRSHGLSDIFDDNTSVHVHVDIRDMEYEDLGSMLQYWTLFEKMVFNAFAPNRYNNNFCCPMGLSFGQVNAVARLFQLLDRGAHSLAFDGAGRYGAMNLQSVLDRGSIEFRLFEGAYLKEDLLRYINVLLSIKKVAMEGGENAMRPYINMKGRALRSFITDIFGKELTEYMMYSGIYDDVKEGMELARYIANYGEFQDASAMVSNYLYRSEGQGSSYEEVSVGSDQPLRPQTRESIVEAMLRYRTLSEETSVEFNEEE